MAAAAGVEINIYDLITSYPDGDATVAAAIEKYFLTNEEDRGSYWLIFYLSALDYPLTFKTIIATMIKLDLNLVNAVTFFITIERIEAVRELLRQGYRPKTREERGQIFRTLACNMRHGWEDVSSPFLVDGESVDIRADDDTQSTPLEVALMDKNVFAIKFFIENGADILYAITRPWTSLIFPGSHILNTISYPLLENAIATAIMKKMTLQQLCYLVCILSRRDETEATVPKYILVVCRQWLQSEPDYLADHGVDFTHWPRRIHLAKRYLQKQ